MLPIPRSLTSGVLAYAGPLLAAALALAGALVCRPKARRALLPAVGAGAALAGWAAMLPRGTVLQAASGPRNGPELLLLPATAAVGLSLLALWWFRERAAAALAVAVSAWWVAGSPAARAEFWRVWAATAALGWVLSKAVGAQPFRGLAAPLALCGGLGLAGASVGWTEAALVAAAGWAGLMPAGAGAVIPAGLMSGLVVGADLAAGRLVRGRIDAADLTCAIACAAPFLAGAIAARTKRLGAAGPALAGIAAGLVGAGAAWLADRALRP
ncbi:MAG: hypothetical protein JOZ05_00180 [Acetobacteraceae bacterium]|nr:hypothetical protein [Acetobacteraceae bacterium]